MVQNFFRIFPKGHLINLYLYSSQFLRIFFNFLKCEQIRCLSDYFWKNFWLTIVQFLKYFNLKRFLRKLTENFRMYTKINVAQCTEHFIQLFCFAFKKYIFFIDTKMNFRNSCFNKNYISDSKIVYKRPNYEFHNIIRTGISFKFKIGVPQQDN